MEHIISYRNVACVQIPHAEDLIEWEKVVLVGQDCGALAAVCLLASPGISCPESRCPSVAPLARVEQPSEKQAALSRARGSELCSIFTLMYCSSICFQVPLLK